jgi:ABC-type branched-subunit amino acid transport system substrate-binding protein
MRHSALRSLAVFLLILAGCPKNVPIEQPGGQTPAEPQAEARAKAELDILDAQTASQSHEKAAEAYEALARRVGETTSAAEALFRAAQHWRAARLPERASAALTQLLTRFPLAARANEAKFQLAIAQIEMGRPRDGYQALTSLYDKLPADQRAAGAVATAEGAEAAHFWPEAIRWRLEAAARLEGPAREAQLARATQLLDGELSFLDVAKLKEELPPDSPLLGAVVMKLARVYVHLRSYDEAEAAARDLLTRWPDGPYAADARALLDRLSQRSQANPKVIGVAVPMSGKNKGWGEAILQGVGMALEGSGLKIVVKDTRGEADGAAKAMEELALTDGAIAAIGAVTNVEAPRAAAQAQELGMPLLTLSKLEGITGAGQWVFREMLTASAQAKALAEFAFVRRNMRRFGLLYPSIPYGVELANAFWDEVDARGGEVRAAETYEHDRTTFAPLVKEMVGKLHLEERRDFVQEQSQTLKDEADPYRRKKALRKLRDELEPVIDFEAVFIPDFAKNLALVTPALAVEDIITSTCNTTELERIRKSTGNKDLQPVQLFGANGWDDPTLVEKAGRYVECAIFVDGFYAASARPETRKFVEAFQAKYQHPPSILEASAYDSARLVRQQLERGAITRDAVRSGLASVRAFPSASGEMSFDKNREPVRDLFFLTVEKGAIRELTAEEMAAQGAGGR